MAIETVGSWGWAAVGTIAMAMAMAVGVGYLGLWRPYKMHSFYRRSKVRGPPYRPLVGNLAHIWSEQMQASRIEWQIAADPPELAASNLPHLEYWSKLYGRMFTYMEGAKLNLCILDTEIIRELLVLKADCYRSSPSGWLWRTSHGAGGLLRKDAPERKMSHCEPERWSTLRRILGPGSNRNHVQDCLHTIVTVTESLMRRWEFMLQESCDDEGRMELGAWNDIQKTSMDILLTNMIGSTMTDDQLETVHLGLENSQEEHSAIGDFLRVPFPHSSKESFLNQLIIETVEGRLKAPPEDGKDGQLSPRNRDLLDLMISSCGLPAKNHVQNLVADCQMMVAAQKATTQLIFQTLQLLARHTEWQDRARSEVLLIRPLDPPLDEDGDPLANSTYPQLAKLKIMDMILNESLRLLPPILSTEKLCSKRHRLGKYTVLPGTFVQVPIVLLHRSPELWGDDALSFRPQRFENGAGARRPFALLPFSAGPSVCLGYNFALQEAKIVLAAVIGKFFVRPSIGDSKDDRSARMLNVKQLMLDDFAVASRRRLTRRHSNPM